MRELLWGNIIKGLKFSLNLVCLLKCLIINIIQFIQNKTKQKLDYIGYFIIVELEYLNSNITYLNVYNLMVKILINVSIIFFFII